MTPFAQGLMEQLRDAPSHRLTAIVEMARLEPAERRQLVDQYGAAAKPLLNQDCFSNVRDLGPWLLSPGQHASLQSQYDFHCTLAETAGDAVCGWLISAAEFSELAAHLAQATTAQGPDGGTYMLRFHTEQAFPVLHARRDLPGIAALLAPVRSWWVIEPDPERKAWRQFAGYDRPRHCGVPLIQLDQRCWDALAGAPLSYRLAEQLRDALGASGMPDNCHGTRLGQVRKLLAEARRNGLTRPADQSDYVTLLTLHGRQLRGTPAWQQALAQARDEARPLALALKARLFRKPE